MLHIAQTVGAVACALTLFQCATLMIGGHLFKDALSGFYDTFPYGWQRMLIVLLPLAGVGNLFAAYAFQSPMVAGISFMVLGVWVHLIAAAVVHQKSYSLIDLMIIAGITALALILAIRTI